MKTLLPKHSRHGFTLVELLVVITIIALLLSLSFPAFTQMMQKAKSVKCGQNLRSIGVAVSQATSENNNVMPQIDQAAISIYPPAGSVPGILGVLGPYGVTGDTLQCPADNGSPSNYTHYGSSYEWNPCLDDETPLAPVLYITDTRQIPIKSARWRLCTDFLYSAHNGKANALYADGHVTAR